MKKLCVVITVSIVSFLLFSCDGTDSSEFLYSEEQEIFENIEETVQDNQTEQGNQSDQDQSDSEEPAIVKMTEKEQSELFKTYVAIGDSVSHGCQGLNVEEGRQYYSAPAQLARQMKTEFNQPLVEYPGVGIPNPEDAIREGWIDTYAETINIVMKTFLYWYRVDRYDNQENLNNFGFMGGTLDQALSYDPLKIFNGKTSPLIDMIGLASPFYLSVTGLNPLKSKSAVDQALDRNPTFVSIWLGNNDTMMATVLGGEVSLNTSLDYYKEKWDELVAKIKATKSVMGVLIINIPDNTSLPVMQPVNNQYHEVKEGVNIPEGSKVPFFVTKSSSLDQVVTPDQLKTIQDRIIAINAIQEETARKENWAFADAYSIFKKMSNSGMTLLNADGSESDIVLTFDFGTGGIISLDGIHPTSAAYAHIANRAIKTINEHYGTSMELVDEVAVWEQDSLCQDPFDPRETNPEIMGNMSFLFNTFASFLGLIY